MLKYEELPNWLISLNQEDLDFVKKMIVFSGSLKELAKVYQVTYPTMRIKLDKLINKIKENDVEINDSYTERIKQLALEDKIELDVAKELISAYRKFKQSK